MDEYNLYHQEDIESEFSIDRSAAANQRKYNENLLAV